MNHKVLVVERDCVFGRSIVNLMAGYGIETDHVTTAEEAVICCSRTSYDVALINLHMPSINGIKLARMVMANDPHTETILVSEMGTVNDYIKALSVGVSEFIYKSVETGVLVAIIRKILKMKALRKGHQFENGRPVSLKIRGLKETHPLEMKKRTIQ